MSDLESKLRGEKKMNYCSDSEDDDDNLTVLEHPGENSTRSFGPNTGPKGVLKDYKEYKELKRIEKIESDRQKIELHKKLAFTADPNKHPDAEDEEFDEDDEFMKNYREKRIAELMKRNDENLVKYDKLFELNSTELLETIENQDKNSLMIVHIYDTNIPACVLMNRCLTELVKEYPAVKFGKVLVTNTGLSLHFKMNALPTLQVYKNGDLIGNYVRISDELDTEFYTGDVENYLIEAGILYKCKHK